MRDLEFVAEPGGAAEVVSRPATRTPHPTRTGGQDDGSYTNSLKCLEFENAGRNNERKEFHMSVA